MNLILRNSSIQGKVLVKTILLGAVEAKIDFYFTKVIQCCAWN